MQRTATNERKAPRGRRAMNHVARKPTGTGSPAIDRAATIAHQTVDRMATAAAPAAGWMNTSTAELKRRQDALIASTRRLVQQKPLIILGAALAFAYAVGRLRR
jgi:hypothetical protein